jgi:hypothetical protein
MIDKLIEHIKANTKEVDFDNNLHDEVYRIIMRERDLFNARTTEEPDTLNRDTLILVI